VEHPLNRFPDDPAAGDGHQQDFAKRGEVLEFAVAVGVVFVGRAVADLYGNEGEHGAHHIEAGVGRVRKDSERPGEQARPELQQRHGRGRQHGVQRHPPLFSREASDNCGGGSHDPLKY
jgi:hypothetical protein